MYRSAAILSQKLYAVLITADWGVGWVIQWSLCSVCDQESRLICFQLLSHQLVNIREYNYDDLGLVPGPSGVGFLL